ncbi:hypothetical protein BD779DRAFT_1467480 [Infundibulicybe gibba]|nr:hypothetical protein BD779DRAFT_1467480 [Infundibulicybe gibba]
MLPATTTAQFAALWSISLFRLLWPGRSHRTQFGALSIGGIPQQREYAKKTISEHLLLVTLLRDDMVANETLPVIPDSVEGQDIAAIAAWPVAKLLEPILTPWNHLSSSRGDYTVTIIGATFDLQEKVVRQVGMVDSSDSGPLASRVVGVALGDRWSGGGTDATIIIRMIFLVTWRGGPGPGASKMRLPMEQRTPADAALTQEDADKVKTPIYSWFSSGTSDPFDPALAGRYSHWVIEDDD